MKPFVKAAETQAVAPKRKGFSPNIRSSAPSFGTHPI
jgi:hypothetical protein